MKKLALIFTLTIITNVFAFAQGWQALRSNSLSVQAELPGDYKFDQINQNGANVIQAVHNGKDYVLFSVSEYEKPATKGTELDIIAATFRDGDQVIQPAKDWVHGGKTWKTVILYSQGMGGYVHRRVMIDGKRIYNMTYISNYESPEGNADRFFNSIKF